MQSDATTVEEYLAGLPEDRRRIVTEVRDLVRSALPEGFVEQMDYGMIAWVVPFDVVPETYNGHPLTYAALASQKSYVSLYLMGLYTGAGGIGEDELRARWSGGRRLDMGKSCVRFRSVDDLDAELLREVIGQQTLGEFAAAAKCGPRGTRQAARLGHAMSVPSELGVGERRVLAAGIDTQVYEAGDGPPSCSSTARDRGFRRGRTGG